MLHHLSSLSGHHKESGSLEPSRGQSQQFSCYKAVFKFFLWQHYHGILAWGEWTYSDRCLDLKRENDHKYTHYTEEAVTTVTTTCQGGVGVGVAHLSVLWTTSAALSLLSLFLLLSRVQSRVMDSPAFVTHVLTLIFPSWAASHLTWSTGPWPAPPWRWTSWRRSSSRQPPQGLLWNEQFSLFCLFCF